mgnify:CR=1 FL=1
MSAVGTTSQIPGVTYEAFLSQVASEPFKVWKTEIISSSYGQIEQPVAVRWRDANGDRKDFVISPHIDPNQPLTDRINDLTEYIFDGFTSLVFNQINASATVTLRLYPVRKFSAVNLLNGENPVEEYNDEKPYVLQLVNSSTSAVANEVVGDSYSTLTAGGTGTYKKYVALLTQDGTAAPTAIVLESEFGTIVWARTSQSVYTGTLAGAFTNNKTFSFISQGELIDASAIAITRTSANVLTITSNVIADSWMTNCSIEIRVYA